MTQVMEHRPRAATCDYLHVFDTSSSIMNTKNDLRRRSTAPLLTNGVYYSPEATEILPNLFISDLYTATDFSFLDSHRITHRLSVQIEPVELPHPNFSLKMKHVPLADKCDARLWMHLDSAADWIHAALGISQENGEEEFKNVLVHCRKGMSRSVALVLGYLIKYRGMALDDALSFVQSKRPISKPNSGFMKQLKAYEEGMRGRRGERATL